VVLYAVLFPHVTLSYPSILQVMGDHPDDLNNVNWLRPRRSGKIKAGQKMRGSSLLAVRDHRRMYGVE
jgi:hypothetical protein